MLFLSLPGDCHSTAKRCFAMTEYFVRNITRVCLLKSNGKIRVLFMLFRATHLCNYKWITQYVPFCLSKPKTINAILSAFTNFRT